MKEQSTDIFFDSLVQVLFQDLGFYIPSDIIYDKLLIELESSIPECFLDELHILDIDGGLGKFEVEEFNQRLLKKRDLLEKNIFKLLRKKDEIGVSEFVYIIEKYLDQLAFYIFITVWLKTNLKLFNKDKINIITIGSFEIQYECFQFHLKEFTKNFGSLTDIGFKINFTSYELVKGYIFDLVSRYGLAGEKSISNPKVETIELVEEAINKDNLGTKKSIDKKKSIKKVQKKPLLTENEIEDFLLESVFEVKLK
jgi:hypothetical protein